VNQVAVIHVDDAIIVVENGAPGSSAAALGTHAGAVTIIATGANLGFGAGVNRGVAACDPAVEMIVVANPDSVVHPGALGALRAALDGHPTWAMVGPTIVTAEGERYPSVRRFPSFLDAVGHALLGQVAPANRFTTRYRSAAIGPDGGVDWVSGAFFVIRRDAFEEIGGFDEAYFMFAEDMDLCWRLHHAGRGVGVATDAVVTHVEGVARRPHPYRMLIAHHRSALRFANETTAGPARALLPLAALVLGVRLIGSIVQTSLRARRGSGAR
jgi:N-acetylglucosaminyl-diphospho-decaprenol L-rhamnosyltransferase